MIRDMIEKLTVKELEDKGYIIGRCDLPGEFDISDDKTLIQICNEVREKTGKYYGICWDDAAKGNDSDFFFVDEDFDDSRYSGYSILY